MDKSASKEVIGNAGSDMFTLLYGGKLGDELASLRHRNYMRMAAAASSLNPSKLPPTKRTAYFHSLRVKLQVNILLIFFKILKLVLQVHEWSELEDSTLDPLDWGWSLKDNKMTPIVTDQVYN